MRLLLEKFLWLLAAILFVVLVGHAYFQGVIRLGDGPAQAMAFLISGIIPIAYLVRREEPLPALIDNVWVGACGISVFGLIDTILRLGYIKHGLLSFLPIHIFTIYVWWVMEQDGEVNQQKSVLILALAIGALLLSALFNFG